MLLRLNPAVISSAMGIQLAQSNIWLRQYFQTTIEPEIYNRMRFSTARRSDCSPVGITCAMALFLVAYKHRPRFIVEVGTYLGIATLGAGAGAALTTDTINILSCDINPAIENPMSGIELRHGAVVETFQTSSTMMFKGMVDNKLTADFLILDGRLSKEDIVLLKNIIHDRTVIAIDDCQNFQKGHANLALLQSAGLLEAHTFVEPFSTEVFRLWGYETWSALGFCVPKSSLVIRNQ